jgi:phosphoglycerate dehydrogenase-like enzyme
MANGYRRLIAAAVALCLMAPAGAQDAIDRLVEQSGIQAGPVAFRELPRWAPGGKIVIRDRDGEAAEIRRRHPELEVVAVASAAEALRHMSDAIALVGYCSPELVAAAPALVWTQIYSAGAEHCFASERIRNGEVVLTNMQKMDAPVIAEHVIAMVLALARGLPAFAKSMDTGAWLDDSGIVAGMDSIAGKTLLVAGLGGIGTEVARRAAALDMRVTGTRRSSREGPPFVAYVGLSDELQDLAAEADFIVNALPLTAETEGLFDAHFFAGVRKGAYFINVGRGGSVVTNDLYAALRDGRIAGIGLDVTDPEPLPAGHPLWQEPNAIVTPHVAGEGSNWSRKRILLLENVARYVEGAALYNVVDPDRGY